jgi:hypothetical protein
MDESTQLRIDDWLEQIVVEIGLEFNFENSEVNDEILSDSLFNMF